MTLALAGAAHLTLKADSDDLRLVEARGREVEKNLATIQSDLAEIKVGQETYHEELPRLRQGLEKEEKRRNEI